MNTNEQQTKTLGQIAYEAIYPTWSWGACPDKQGYEKAASAVEAAVLSRLGGEWIVLHPDAKHEHGDEFWCEERWLPVGEENIGRRVGSSFACRRRIHPSPTPDVHVATESAEWKPDIALHSRVRRTDDGSLREGTVIAHHHSTGNYGVKLDDGAHLICTDGDIEELPQPPSTPAGERTSTIPCCLCNGPVEEFSIPNEAWNRIIRKGGPETDKEYLCWACFEKAALQQVTRERDEAVADGKSWRRVSERLEDELGQAKARAESAEDGSEIWRKSSNHFQDRAIAAEKRLAEVEKALALTRPFYDAGIQMFNAIKDAK